MKNKKMIKVVSFMGVAAACALSGVFAINATSASANSEEIFHELGASIRVSTDKGIRFSFGLPAEYTGDDYEIGTLIVPKEVLGTKTLNHNNDTSDTEEVDYMPIPCTKNWVPNEGVKDAKEGYFYYNAALTNIPQLHYNTVLVARSYFVKDGVYTYSDPVERSIGYVASAVLNKGYEDTNEILTNIVSTGYGEREVSVEFQGLNQDFITDKQTTALENVNELGYLPVWSSSNSEVATVDNEGNVTAVKGGETTITATIGTKSASKTVFVKGDSLYSNQVSVISNQWDVSNNEGYLTVSQGNNGELVIDTQFSGSQNCYSALVLRNLYSKAYYQALIEKGYTTMNFVIEVGGTNAADTSDLYVFGKKITNFVKTSDGAYVVTADVQAIVDNYDTIGRLGYGEGGAATDAQLDQMFIAWKNESTTWIAHRFYTFTISYAQFEKDVLASDAIGMRVNGYNMTTNSSHMTMDRGENGEMIISANWTTSDKYYPMLTLKGVESKEFYQNLIASGYSKLAFTLTVGGTNAADVSDLYVFGKTLTSFPKTANGAYAIVLDLGHIITQHTNITTLATSSGQAGQSGSLGAMFIAWKAPLEWNNSRNYEFTISNPEYVTAGLYSLYQIGLRADGADKTNDTAWLKKEIGANGELIVTAKFKGNANYYPMLTLRELEPKTFYENLKANGWTYLTFDLKIGGDDAENITDVRALGGVVVADCPQENGVYKVKVQIQHIITYYDTLLTMGTSTNTAGASSSKSGMFLAWRNAAADNGTERDYVFTFSNVAFSKS